MEATREYTITAGVDIAELELMPGLRPIAETVARTVEFFFKGSMKSANPPFRGFLLHGVPGTGKTEIVKQVAARLARRLNGVYLVFVDGASIASPRWGDAERRLREVFNAADNLRDRHRDPKAILLFDDIESLMLSRGTELAKEWHYSINSILFHELDRLNPIRTIVCATTNRIDLVDVAVTTRLHPIEVPPVKLSELETLIRQFLEESRVSKDDAEVVVRRVLKRLESLGRPATIRDVRQIVVVECIEGGIWSV